MHTKKIQVNPIGTVSIDCSEKNQLMIKLPFLDLDKLNSQTSLVEFNMM